MKFFPFKSLQCEQQLYHHCKSYVEQLISGKLYFHEAALLSEFSLKIKLTTMKNFGS